MSCLVSLAFFSYPLPWYQGETFALPTTYRWGLFTGVAIGLLFFAISAWRTGRDEARLARALEAAEEVLAKEQRLSALGALSAATAHELGTPLATIHLVAKELARATSKDDPQFEDVALIAEQAERCRNILGQISRGGEMEDAAHAKLPVSALIDEISEPHMGLGIDVRLSVEPLPEASDAFVKPPEIKRRPEIIHALGAFVENAVSFAEKEVHVIARWSDDELRIYIVDDGPGFSQSVLPKLGEPYLSQRGPNQRGGGMGLGFFIARTLLERTGARLKPYNRKSPTNGAVVRVSWKLSTIRAAPGWES
jgi:two-component system sensor histidine kinase RegB